MYDLNGLYCIISAIIICRKKHQLNLVDNEGGFKIKIVYNMDLPDIFVNLEQSSGLDCTVLNERYNKDRYLPSEK